MIGGCGRCTGNGSPEYPVTRTNCPSQSIGSPDQCDFDQPNDLFELRDPIPRFAKDESHRLVFSAVGARTDPELEAAIREQVERRCLLGQYGRDVVVDAEDPTPDTERRRPGGCRSHGRNGSEHLWLEKRGCAGRSRTEVVIGKGQRRVTEVLGPSCQIAPLGG